MEKEEIKKQIKVYTPQIPEGEWLTKEEAEAQEKEEQIKKEMEKQKGIEAEEEEEKEVAPAGSMTSEETHGGKEATESIEESPSASEEGEEEAGVLEEQEEQEEQEEGSESKTEQETGTGAGEEDTESTAGTGETEMDKESAGSEGETDKEGEGEDETGEKDSVEGAGEEEDTGEGEGEDEESGDTIGEGEAEEDTEEESTGEDEDTGEGETETEEEGEEGQSVGEKKYEEAFTIKEITIMSKLKSAFYNMVNVLADITVVEVPGTDVFSIRRHLKKTIEPRPAMPYESYVQQIKNDIYLFLDNSGSMIDYMAMVNAMASLAMKRKDVYVYTSPNGAIPDEIWENPQRINGMPVLYFGDFDGGNTPVWLSMQGAIVIWFCNEERYTDTIQHNWCSFSLHEIIYDKRVTVYWTATINELYKAMLDVVKNYRQIKFWRFGHKVR